MRRKVIYVKPTLKDCDNNLTKAWYVEYQYRNPKTNVLERFRIYKGLGIKCQCEKTRRDRANKIIQEYIDKLQICWSPFSVEDKVYEDQIEYHNIARIYSRMRKNNNSIKIHFSAFLSAQKLKVSEKTFESYQSKIRLFYQFIEYKGLADNDITIITNKLVIGFFQYIIKERNLDKITVMKYKQNINSLCGYLVKEKLIFENPVYDVPIPPKKVDNAPQEFLEEDRIRLLDLIKNEDPQIYLACLFQYYCAIRPGHELRLLKIKQINFKIGLVTINSVDAKAERSRVIHIAEDFRLLLIKFGINNYNKEFYVFSKFGVPGPVPLGKNNMRNRFNSYRDFLRLNKDYKFYSWKHTGAGALDDANVPLRDIQEHLGHSNPEQTANYLKKRRGYKNNIIKFNFPSPG